MRTNRHLSLAVAVLASFLAAGVLATGASTAASAPAAGVTRAGTLHIGSRGSSVLTLQRELTHLTYLPSNGVDGVFGSQTWYAVVAFQGWDGLARDGVAGPRTLSALSHAHAPVPWSRAQGMEVHIAQQVLLLVTGGRVTRAIHVSTGMPGWPTPLGHFHVSSRQTLSWSVPFHAWMPLAQYFDGGYAVHEYETVPAYPASHGCVRVPEAEARAVWSFGRIGMRVWTVR